MVNDQKVEKFNGDLDDYQKWLFDTRKQQFAGLEPEKEVVKTVVQDNSKRIKNNTKQVGLLEKELNKLHAEKQQIATLLADQKIYQPENRVELENCLKKSALLEEKIKTLEEKWFELQG